MRILFFAEAVTLAHVARPLRLARAAVGAGCEVAIACDQRYRSFVQGADWRWLPMESIPSDQFAQSLAKGSPVFDLPTLRRYLSADLRLIDEYRPDLIVGDFRLTLSVSARLACVPYAAITNAYWSPFTVGRGYPMPVLPLSKMLPIPVAQVLFDAFAPLAMTLHCTPLNRLRRDNGMEPLGSDLRRVYTDADHTLYADAPEMFDLSALPATHHYLGPMLWSPDIEKPSWWDRIDGRLPIVYVTLGSSGSLTDLSRVLDALADLPLMVLASTAGGDVSSLDTHRNVHVAEYLPGSLAAKRARLVICNGGSPTSQQALAAGVPVLAIASNMDQFLNMRQVVGHGAGRVLRSDRLGAADLSATVADMLEDRVSLEAARKLSVDLGRHDCGRNFIAFLDTLRTPRVEPSSMVLA
jgi:UDP:flavonoid glycosyltransferase YjiC (YdhE family)